MNFFKVSSVDETKDIIDEYFHLEVEGEQVDIFNCVNRIAFDYIRADCNIPEFKRSTVDGFAVNSRDVFGATEAIPAILTLKGEILMGKVTDFNIVDGECAYVPTGGMLPEYADSVIMLEYTQKLDEDTILVYSPVASGDNVIQKGEDIQNDNIVIRKGEKIRPYEVGVLASIGIKHVNVCKKIKVGIISTGNELIACEDELTLGKIRDINTYMLWAAIIDDGAEPINYGIVKDDYKLLKHTICRATEECDILVISGGSSVGKKDQTIKAIEDFEDGKILVHGVSVKPGKPTIVAKKGDKIIFGLPGHPLACSIVYIIFIREYINKAMCYKKEVYAVKSIMSINYHKAKGREEYLPVALENDGDRIIAKPIFGKSGLISTFSRAWGYIKIEKDLEGLREGQVVEIYKL